MSPFFSRPKPDPEKNEPAKNDPSLFNRILTWLSPSSPPAKTAAMLKEETIRAKWAGMMRQAPEQPYSDAESRQASAKLWTIYVGEAERYDKALVESWKADMEGMLIFSGLFSASLTAFLIESYRSLQPDSGDSTVRLLAQISDQLVAFSSNTSFVSPAPAVFHPPASAVVCNVLWFLSLTLSLTCALLATLVEQWAREFLHKTEKQPSPIRRARVFAFLYFGIRRFGLHFVVDLIPLLLHFALVLFLAGLVAFLSPINAVMTALIGVSLAIFLMLYATITILPLVHLDSPYRTPFSAVAWNLMRAVGRRSHPLPSSTSNITDAVVEMALADSPRRDQRAMQWTVNSLTDENEFLPFLEAIPDAIHGVKGFHLVNDYLFIPLLNGSTTQRSLGSRITDFLFDCRNLDSKDPRRERRLITGMKAIWALGMISGREGEPFNHGSDLWLYQSLDHPIHPNGSFFDSHVKTWPVAFESAASTAMRYSTLNNIRNQITSVLTMAQATVARDTLLVEVAALLIKFQHHLYVPDLPPEFHPTKDALQKWCDDTATGNGGARNVAIILGSVMSEATWTAVYVTSLCRVLLHAADTNFLGGDLPYQFEQTYFKIIPHISGPGGASHMSRQHIFKTSSLEYLHPSRYLRSPDQMAKLDRIMAALLRLLPCVAPDDCMTTVTLYLANRRTDEGIDIALQHCNLPYLLDSLANMLESTDDSSHILHSLCAVLVSTRNRAPVSRWDKRDDIVFDFMAARGIFNNPRFLGLSTVMRTRRLRHLYRSVSAGLSDGGDTREAMDTALAARRSLGTDPVLSSQPDTPGLDDITVKELIVDVETRATSGMIACMTDFILGSAKDPDGVASGHIMGTLCYCFRGSSGVDSTVMVNFANAWLTLVNRLIQDPQQRRLKATLKEWIQRLASRPAEYYSLAAAPQYEEALTLYLEFLEKVGSDPSDTRVITRALTGIRAAGPT
ncbi:hypothetical protein C8R46DRAFT_1120048 [Mycena filopes]|nr:hypothetical protein C8R46DRAFT_1120048 [Mycena filopes]